MTLWLSMAVLLAVGFTVGWHAHLWYCLRSKGCPLWRPKTTAAWANTLTEEGWETKNGKHHRLGETPERHPTGETKTTCDPWSHWQPAPPLDKAEESGAPLERMETPVTGVANKNRKTTP